MWIVLTRKHKMVTNDCNEQKNPTCAANGTSKNERPAHEHDQIG